MGNSSISYTIEQPTEKISQKLCKLYQRSYCPVNQYPSKSLNLYNLEMFGRIARIQVLWIDRNNPNKVEFPISPHIFILISVLHLTTHRIKWRKIRNPWIPQKHPIQRSLWKNDTNEALWNPCQTAQRKILLRVITNFLVYLECYSKKKFIKSINSQNDSIGTVGKCSRRYRRISNKQH